MRVAKLDLNHCPPGLKSMSFNNSTIQSCILNEDPPGCTSELYSALDVPLCMIKDRVRQCSCCPWRIL